MSTTQDTSNNTVVDYQIVVPSRRRAGMMRRLLGMLPTASICIDESELQDYQAVVPAGQLVTHPTFDRMSKIRNWMLANYKATALVMFDDDLTHLRSVVWKKPKRYTDPRTIRGVIENMVNVTADLGMTLGCWSRIAHPVGYSNCDPFGFSSPCSSAFVVQGRKFQFDEQLRSKADIDMSLQALLYDRVVICDRRWYFDFGRIFGNPGGDQGNRTMEHVAQDNSHLKSKWKGHVIFDNRGSSGAAQRARGGRKNAIVGSFRIAVQRKSELAFRASQAEG